MKDEIKEILDILNIMAKENKESDNPLQATVILFEILYKILDYITNLQEENKILKTRNKILAEDITKDRINCDVIQTVCGIPIEEIPELKLYKSRNEKAIEYIKDNLYYLVDNDDKNLLNILNGVANDYEFPNLYNPNISYSKAYTEQLLIEKDKEIEKLNKECDTYMKIATKRGNIIDELEKYTIEQRDIAKDNMEIIGNEGKRMATRFVVYNEYLVKLKELKEGKQ